MNNYNRTKKKFDVMQRNMKIICAESEEMISKKKKVESVIDEDSLYFVKSV